MNFNKAHYIQDSTFSLGQAWEAKVLGVFASIKARKKELSSMDKALLLQVLQEELDNIALAENEALKNVVALAYNYSLITTAADYDELPTFPSLAIGYDKRWFKDKKSYDERIAHNIAAIKSELQGLIIGWQGDDPIVLMGLIYDILQKAENEFIRLIRTELESAYVQGSRDAYLEKGCLYAVVENGSPCDEICAEMVGEHEVPLNGILGLDLPPYHPYCKCVFLGIFGHH